MDHKSYKKFRSTLPSDYLFLDDLNPYELLHQISRQYEGVPMAVLEEGQHSRVATGVRSLLRDLFVQFSSENCTFVIPEDIYPVYYTLVPDKNPLIFYTTYTQSGYRLPDISKAVVLIANPVVPEGRYLSAENLNCLDRWLQVDKSRWLIFDNVYDFNGRAGEDNIRSDNVIYTNSLTKSALTPGVLGWARCEKPFPGSSFCAEQKVRRIFSPFLEQCFTNAWRRIRTDLPELDKFWIVPEVGYMTTVKMDYLSLHDFNVAALPASVFGIKDQKVSVISCVSRVKRDLI